MRRFPPLNSLRAFEAAARHLSFTRAADELNVTPGAISQQVKALEAHLGMQLFRRRHHRLLLTDAAQLCLPRMSAGFDHLAAAVDGLRHEHAAQRLTVTVPPTLGASWLVPRLTDFYKRHPQIEIRIDASTALVDFADSDIDLGIRFGGGVYPRIESACLLAQSVYPVCAPSLLAAGQSLKKPRDLKAYTLLQYDYRTPGEMYWPDWQTWLHAVGADDLDLRYGAHFTSIEMVIQAAIEGQGMALAGHVLVEEDLRHGRLVRPLTESMLMEHAYYIVHPPGADARPPVRAFKAWLLEQGAACEAGCAPRVD